MAGIRRLRLKDLMKELYLRNGPVIASDLYISLGPRMIKVLGVETGVYGGSGVKIHGEELGTSTSMKAGHPITARKVRRSCLGVLIVAGFA